MKHLIEAQQLDKETIYRLFEKSDFLRKNQSSSMKGKVMTTLFYEPSTRTRLSFEAAMLKLGGTGMGTESAEEFSSAVKGESLEDTIRVVSKYCDVIVMRHKVEGSVMEASILSSVPVINAGDGKGQHPTQTLLDIYTINRELGKIDGIKIAMVGDLASGRTVRSLCYLLGKFENIKIIFVSPENLKIGQDIKEYLNKHNVKYTEENNLEEVLPKVDVVYMTRIQKERISKEDYDKSNGKYIISEKNLNLIKEGSIIMHPLPHVEEINLSMEIEENDLRVAYFRQAENGLYMRMAILEELLNILK